MSAGNMMPPTARTPQTCPQVMARFSFIDCDGDEFEEVQCRPQRGGGEMCYCVDPMTGDRTNDRSYTSEDEVNCDGKYIAIAI